MFLIKEFFKSFVFSKKKRIGFVLSVLPSPYYGRVMASTRLRVYDVINNFQNSKDYFLELYKPWKKYDVVIFQKKFDDKALRLAQKLKKKGVKIILDINVNYYDRTVLNTSAMPQHNQIIQFTQIVDGIIASTEYIKNYAKKLFPEKKIICIPENITDNFFSVRKKTKEKNDHLKLMYVGYAVKAIEVLDIEKVLRELHKNYNLSLLLICDKNPEILVDGIKVGFIKYKQRKIHKQMLGGDIFIAPRDLSNSYNSGHSFTKIGYPMSIGIPVIASKVSSYAGSPAILCESPTDWYDNLSLLLKDTQRREAIAKDGITYCKENFSESVITKKYLSFFNEITHIDRISSPE